MRKPIIAGNWKLHHNPRETGEFLSSFLPLVQDITGVEMVICPPFVSLTAAREALAGSAVALGAQDVFWEEKGAFTGEVAPGMLAECGCRFVIIGHSERRQYFGETDETVNKKVKAAFRAGLVPIVCVGETLGEREKGLTEEVVTRQTRGAFADVPPGDVERAVIAYEPVWAIGTGKTSNAAEANRVIGLIRQTISREFGAAAGDAVRIQYGGSVKPENIADFMAASEIDGALVGGASLKPADFAALIRNGRR